MDETRSTNLPHRVSKFVAVGVLFLGMAALGLALSAAGPAGDGLLAELLATETPTPTLTPTPTATYPPYTGDDDPAPTDEAQPAIAREVIAPPTRTPTPTVTPTPTITPTPEPSPTFDAPEIHWSQADKNALSWLCYGEVGGMGWAKIDACLSVISTVRVRYAYNNSFASDSVVEALTRPGQFPVRIETDRPSPDPELNQAVEQYEQGLRGSCTGFKYFNSVPGYPGECVIYGPAGQFIQFHNSW